MSPTPAVQNVTPERIMRYSWGFAPPLAIEAAVRNKVFDALANGAKTLGEVSRATGASERGLTSILNLLTGLELLTKSGDEYALTPESATFLVSGKPAYLGGMLGRVSEQLIPKWLELGNVVRTGQPTIQVNEGQESVEFFGKLVSA